MIVRLPECRTGSRTLHALRAYWATNLLEASGYRDTVHEAYKRFLEINGDLLGVCTDWQMRPGPDGQPVLNDHGAVIDRGRPCAIDQLSSHDRKGAILNRSKPIGNALQLSD